MTQGAFRDLTEQTEATVFQLKGKPYPLGRKAVLNRAAPRAARTGEGNGDHIGGLPGWAGGLEMRALGPGRWVAASLGTVSAHLEKARQALLGREKVSSCPQQLQDLGTGLGPGPSSSLSFWLSFPGSSGHSLSISSKFWAQREQGEGPGMREGHAGMHKDGMLTHPSRDPLQGGHEDQVLLGTERPSPSSTLK